MRESGVSPEDAIGDETRDIEAAKAIGLAAGAVSWGYATPAALRSAEPQFMFESFSRLVAAVLEERRSAWDLRADG